MIVELDTPQTGSEQGRNIIGVGWCGEPDSWFQEPGRFYLGWHVDPAYAELAYGPDGIGRARLAYITKLLDEQGYEPTCFTPFCREGKVERINFLQSQGFQEAMRFQDSALDLTAFDPTPFQDTIEQVQAQGRASSSIHSLSYRQPMTTGCRECIRWK